MVKPYFERGVTKAIMTTDWNIDNDNDQEHEAWGATPEVEAKCKIKLSIQRFSLIQKPTESCTSRK